MIRWRCYMNTYHGWSLSTLPVDCDCCPVFRDCLESSRRVVDRLCVVLQEGEMGHLSRPLLATRYTPNRGLLGLSRQSLEVEFSEVGELSLLSDYGDRAMGVADNRTRDTAQQSPL